MSFVILLVVMSSVTMILSVLSNYQTRTRIYHKSISRQSETVKCGLILLVIAVIAEEVPGHCFR